MASTVTSENPQQQTPSSYNNTITATATNFNANNNINNVANSHVLHASIGNTDNNGNNNNDDNNNLNPWMQELEKLRKQYIQVKEERDQAGRYLHQVEETIQTYGSNPHNAINQIVNLFKSSARIAAKEVAEQMDTMDKETLKRIYLNAIEHVEDLKHDKGLLTTKLSLNHERSENLYQQLSEINDNFEQLLHHNHELIKQNQQLKYEIKRWHQNYDNLKNTIDHQQQASSSTRQSVPLPSLPQQEQHTSSVALQASSQQDEGNKTSIIKSSDHGQDNDTDIYPSVNNTVAGQYGQGVTAHNHEDSSGSHSIDNATSTSTNINNENVNSWTYSHNKVPAYPVYNSFNGHQKISLNDKSNYDSPSGFIDHDQLQCDCHLLQSTLKQHKIKYQKLYIQCQQLEKEISLIAKEKQRYKHQLSAQNRDCEQLIRERDALRSALRMHGNEREKERQDFNDRQSNRLRELQRVKREKEIIMVEYGKIMEERDIVHRDMNNIQEQYQTSVQEKLLAEKQCQELQLELKKLQQLVDQLKRDKHVDNTRIEALKVNLKETIHTNEELLQRYEEYDKLYANPVKDKFDVVNKNSTSDTAVVTSTITATTATTDNSISNKPVTITNNDWSTHQKLQEIQNSNYYSGVNAGCNVTKNRKEKLGKLNVPYQNTEINGNHHYDYLANGIRTNQADHHANKVTGKELSSTVSHQDTGSTFYANDTNSNINYNKNDNLYIHNQANSIDGHRHYLRRDHMLTTDSMGNRYHSQYQVDQDNNSAITSNTEGNNPISFDLKSSHNSLYYDSAIDIDYPDDEIDIQFCRSIVRADNCQFGFSYRNSKECSTSPYRNGITISCVHKGSPSYGILYVGDDIRSINKVDLSTFDPNALLQFMRNMAEEKKITVIGNRKRPLYVKIAVTPVAISFADCIQVDSDHIITAIVPEIIAATDGELSIGDKLLAINNLKLDDMTGNEITQLLHQNSQHIMNLFVQKYDVVAFLNRDHPNHKHYRYFNSNINTTNSSSSNTYVSRLANEQHNHSRNLSGNIDYNTKNSKLQVSTQLQQTFGPSKSNYNEINEITNNVYSTTNDPGCNKISKLVHHQHQQSNHTSASSTIEQVNDEMKEVQEYGEMSTTIADQQSQLNSNSDRSMAVNTIDSVTKPCPSAINNSTKNLRSVKQDNNNFDTGSTQLYKDNEHFINCKNGKISNDKNLLTKVKVRSTTHTNSIANETNTTHSLSDCSQQQLSNGYHHYRHNPNSTPLNDSIMVNGNASKFSNQNPNIHINHSQDNVKVANRQKLKLVNMRHLPMLDNDLDDQNDPDQPIAQLQDRSNSNSDLLNDRNSLSNTASARYNQDEDKVTVQYNSRRNNNNSEGFTHATIMTNDSHNRKTNAVKNLENKGDIKVESDLKYTNVDEWVKLVTNSQIDSLSNRNRPIYSSGPVNFNSNWDNHSSSSSANQQCLSAKLLLPTTAAQQQQQKPVFKSRNPRVFHDRKRDHLNSHSKYPHYQSYASMSFEETNSGAFYQSYNNLHHSPNDILHNLSPGYGSSATSISYYSSSSPSSLTGSSLYHHDIMLSQRGIMTPTSSILPSSRIFSQSSRSLLLSESGISGNISSSFAASSCVDDIRLFQSHVNNTRKIERYEEETEDSEERQDENTSSATDPRYVTVKQAMLPLNICIALSAFGGVFVTSMSYSESRPSKIGLRPGDQLLRCNDIDLTTADLAQAEQVLTGKGKDLYLIVQYNPQGYKPLNESVGSDTSQPQTPVTRRRKHVSSIASSRGSSIRSVHSTNNDKNSAFLIQHEALKQPVSSRIVNFRRTGKVKIGIVGGNAAGIFISEIDSTNIAYQPAGSTLKIGDQIIELNKIDFRNLTIERAIRELARLPENNSFIVAHCPQKHRIVEEQQMKDSFYVRALFNYNSGDSGELSFRRGDVLHITDTLYGNKIGSWKATIIADERFAYRKTGKIPSKIRIDDSSQYQLVDNAMEEESKSSKRSSFINNKRNFFRRKKTQDKINSSNLNRDSTVTQGDSQTVQEIFPYEKIDRYLSEYPRPIVLFGPYAKAVANRLIDDYPDKYQCAKIENQKTTIQVIERGLEDQSVLDYEQIDDGSFNCLRTTAIKTVAEEEKKHCILELSPSAIERAESWDLYPIVILLKEQKDLRFKSEKYSSKQAKDIYDAMLKIEQDYQDKFSVILDKGNIAVMYDSLITSIEEEQRKPVWRVSYQQNNI
ncbi:uncharacterized protein TRIADDRAFT_55754 [Trichoplax adhaerens]|uniref:Uncharacterized protein n=1 Tax=Trichoplax adhaerens TaxID=10228 RepID=B3RVS1_TRIAD|nr:predicted protein [Trichoplax adhaerens]EDV26046.1 predicted protein [Trichoplax adhaerens]|eukprot:XP_002112079.1 predicted protein [Trichoplax adhaerens]